jgi:hypothetical protein
MTQATDGEWVFSYNTVFFFTLIASFHVLLMMFNDYLLFKTERQSYGRMEKELKKKVEALTFKQTTGENTTVLLLLALLGVWGSI